MLAAALVLAALAAALHVYIFLLEAVLFARPEVHRRFRTRTEDVPAVRPWAFNQGFYNLFLAIGAILGVVLVVAGNGATGWTLVVFSTASMLGAAVVLAGTGRRYLNSAFVQGSLPLITLLGLQGGRLVGGALITETVFSWPGMGRLLVESLAARDYPVLMAAFMLMSALVIAGNLAADLTYGAADPRIRLD